LKKRSKKLFLIWGMGVFRFNAQVPDSQKFLRRFFQKAAACFSVCVARRELARAHHHRVDVE
jgi:hypothetical protein